jgi:hypothetical protein
MLWRPIIPGPVSCTVNKNGDVILQIASSVVDEGVQEKMTTDIVFGIASCTKMKTFTEQIPEMPNKPKLSNTLPGLYLQPARLGAGLGADVLLARPSRANGQYGLVGRVDESVLVA